MALNEILSVVMIASLLMAPVLDSTTQDSSDLIVNDLDEVVRTKSAKGGGAVAKGGAGCTDVPAWSNWMQPGTPDIEFRYYVSALRTQEFVIQFRSASGYDHSFSKVQLVLGTGIEGIDFDAIESEIILSGASVGEFSCGLSCKSWDIVDNILILKDVGFDGLIPNGGVLDLTVTFPVKNTVSLGTETFPVSSNTIYGVNSVMASTEIFENVDGWVGSDYCNVNDVWDTNRTWTWDTNTSSFCYTDTLQLKEACTYGCASGACQIPDCFNNSDCGTDGYLSNDYCSGLDVWDTYRTHTCNNPGTLSASCTFVDNDQTKETCPSGCSSGACIIECYNDAECGTDYWVGSDFCSSDDVWDDYHEFTCNNPGTKDSSCSEAENPLLKENCTYGCASGACQIPECFNNADCGTDGWLGTYCSGLEVWDTDRTYTCQNPGTLSANCLYTDNDQLQETCVYECGSGVCLYPDLVVKYLLKQGPDNPVAGQDVVLAFMLENIGDAAVSNINWQLDFGDSNMLTGTVANLNAGETSSITMRKNNYTTSGTFVPAVTVDQTSSITELDETNNDKNLSLDIS